MGLRLNGREGRAGGTLINDNLTCLSFTNRERRVMIGLRVREIDEKQTQTGRDGGGYILTFEKTRKQNNL